MGRKKSGLDVAEAVVPLIGLFMLLGMLGMLNPGIRKAIAGLVEFLVIFVVLAFVCMAVFVVHQLGARRNTAKDADMESAIGLAPLAEKKVAQERTPASMIYRLREVDWFRFERVMGAIFAKQGYQVEQRGGANPDGGIDLVLEKAGERTAVQCKHWKSWNLGVKPVREFLGAMTDAGIRKGIVATLSGYTGEAKQLADKHGIEILNEAGLTRMLEAIGACQDEGILAVLEDKTKYCPKCGQEMVLRTATKGMNAGSNFWGCTTYPRCRFTMPVEENERLKS